MNQAQMIEETIRLGLGRFSEAGALVVQTGKYTGRATQERFVVQRRGTETEINWGTVNRGIPEEAANRLFQHLETKLAADSYVFEGSLGGRTVCVRSPSPWHIAFAENMFRTGAPPRFLKGLNSNEAIQVLHDPWGNAQELDIGWDPSRQSQALIVLDPVALKIAIVGTAYAGEIKKSAFSLCNFFLPDFGILPMHASANCLKNGSETCVLFGLSGTGKTTLSASHDRFLVGDDELLWTPGGISNLEAGCYAKLIDLTEEREPEIFRAMQHFGAIAENVPFYADTRRLDFSSRMKTENTRGSYPLRVFEKVFDQNQEAQAPRTVVFLAADAFGALPAVARLNPWQMQYHFISGYTAKVAGTEMGVVEPKAAFSTCFGEPFMPRHPAVYAKLLADFTSRHDTEVWLLNTGWTQGGYGKGPRFPLPITRHLLAAIQSGELSRAGFVRHPVFGFEVPLACPNLDSSWLKTTEGPQVDELARRFVKNMERFSQEVDREVIERGGPRLSGISEAA